jgi:hypothetical protein
MMDKKGFCSKVLATGRRKLPLADHLTHLRKLLLNMAALGFTYSQ